MNCSVRTLLVSTGRCEYSSRRPDTKGQVFDAKTAQCSCIGASRKIFVVFAGFSADEPTKLPELHTANRAQLLFHAPHDLDGVDDPKVRLAINPHLD